MLILKIVDSVECKDDTHIAIPPLSLDIVGKLKTAHTRNGLRHGDYIRYKQYCTSRLARMRKALHFKSGSRNRFQKRLIASEDIVDSRYFEIALINSERAWAYAMYLKSKLPATADEPSRVRFHLINRLRKAAHWSDELEAMAEKQGDARTHLDALAYKFWMNGNVASETNKWSTALQLFEMARDTYIKLGASDVSSNQKDLFIERASMIEPSIVYCKYELQSAEGINDDSEESQRLLHLRSTIDDVLRSKLESVLETSRLKQAESLKSVAWKNNTIQLTNQTVRLSIIKAKEFIFEISRESNIETKLSFFTDIFQCYDDALKQAKDDYKEHESKKKNAKMAQSSLLISYLSFSKIEHTIQRNLLLATKFRSELKNESSDKDIAAKIVAIYDRLLVNLEDLFSIGNATEDRVLASLILVRQLSYQAFRCFFLALSFEANQEWAQAYSWLTKCLELIQSAFKTSDSSHTNEIAECATLRDQATAKRHVVHAKGIISTSCKEEKEENEISCQLLSDRLDKFSAGDAKRNYDLIEFPPTLKTTVVRPVFYDLALASISFPSIKDRTKKKGWLSFFG